ncbi:MAG TPA: cysteine protease StiP family protein [Pseudobacteroides sp.]|uniref:cysteine protease StiP family protein n=1 Tax=Pseudobacteroides sp. TaxID=1968840 RepID=UPI002F95C1F8
MNNLNNSILNSIHEENTDTRTPCTFSGSYDITDVCFLLKEISGLISESDTLCREKAIQSGTHYSEMLPIEYKPSDEYIKLFHRSLNESAQKLANATAVVSNKIIRNRGKNIVLVSLARAGTPVGILIKRYLKEKLGLEVPHYSVSIIRGKGIDENAVRYIVEMHSEQEIQFVDGWTGKGMITRVLHQSCEDLLKKTGIKLNAGLAVLADPGHCVRTYGTREDFLIPSACLNSTVSGLISRTVHRSDLIRNKDFHGVKFYKELIGEDLSNYFIDKIASCFSSIDDLKINSEIKKEEIDEEPSWIGMEDVENVGRLYSIDDINHIKPGIGETIRVLLRRVPWKVLVKDINDKSLSNVLQLAREKKVEVLQYDLKSYKCMGLIKHMGR